MAQPYDMALRERAVAAYERGDGTYAELATLFMLDPRTLERWVARLRATGSVAPRPKGGGWRSPIDLDGLRAVVRAQPDGTALELCRAYNRCVRRAQPRAMNKLSRLSAPLGRPIEGQIRAQARWSRPIVRHPDSYPRSGGCQAEVRRAVFDAKSSGQRWAWPPLRLEPEPQVSTRRSTRPSTRGQHRTPCGS